jgi:hypothetical protein
MVRLCCICGREQLSVLEDMRQNEGVCDEEGECGFRCGDDTIYYV